MIEPLPLIAGLMAAALPLLWVIGAHLGRIKESLEQIANQTCKERV